MNVKSVYILEDDYLLVEIFVDYLAVLGIKTDKAYSWTQVNIDVLKASDLIILDLSLPDFDGLDILEFLAAEKVKIPIILCTGHGDNVANTAVDLLKSQGLTFAGKLIKPFGLMHVEELLQKITNEGLLEKLEKLEKLETEDNSITIDSALNKAELLEAIENNYFSLRYQPQVYSQTGKLYGVECLARLTLPNQKGISPDVFIPALTEFEVMEDFTLYIIKLGLSQLETIALPKNLKIAFNICAQTINSEFLTKLFQCCEGYRFPINNIVLEITETEKLEVSQNKKKLLTKLRLKGFVLSLDDFGTGYSTIQEIDSIPFNQIKIDKMFVQSMKDKKTSDAIVSSTIELANKLNLTVIAEGVETSYQAEKIASLDCKISQGYFYARPLSLSSLADFTLLNNAYH
jgi:EAL domain-containing protein (putative c-di-GMP-specific phosphodiesterase class I)/FixJ family two-component response regulator